MQSTPLAPASPPGPFLLHRVRSLPVLKTSDPRLVSSLHHEIELGIRVRRVPLSSRPRNWLHNRTQRRRQRVVRARRWMTWLGRRVAVQDRPRCIDPEIGPPARYRWN